MRTDGRISLAHLITGTSVGGAETMLQKLVSRIDGERFDVTVISLTSAGEIGRRMIDNGVRLHTIGASRSGLDPAALYRLVRLLREIRPDILQTWMYHADLAGGAAARLAGGIPVAWNIRHSDLDPDHMKKRTIMVARICARLSKKLPERIICCSRASMETHSAYGYDRERMTVIPNGFDTSLFRPDSSARREVREELGIGGNVPLIGLVARFHPQKDHATFIKAAGILRGEYPEARFVLCGGGVTRDNSELAAIIAEAGLEGAAGSGGESGSGGGPDSSGAAGPGDALLLLGKRTDMPRLQASLDIATSSASSGEGFPNILGEAMSCGVPCVATKIGDSAEIIGDTGMIVEPRDPEALAAAWKKMLDMSAGDRSALGERCRKRIIDNYEIGAVTARYEVLYLGMCGRVGTCESP